MLTRRLDVLRRAVSISLLAVAFVVPASGTPCQCLAANGTWVPGICTH